MSDNITGKVVVITGASSGVKREGPILLHRSKVLTTRGALGVRDAERMRQARPGL